MTTSALSSTTLPSSSPHAAGPSGLPDYETNKPRIFLAVACFWPLVVLALFASSSPRTINSTTSATSRSEAILGDGSGAAVVQMVHHLDDNNDHNNLRFNLRNALDRVDIMGYGPTHPRVGVVITGNAAQSDRSHFVATVESVFSHTDLSRIFLVAVVVDGMAPNAQLESDLKKIHRGQVPHLHGLRLDLHESKHEKDQELQHESKVHVLFNEEPLGVTASRQDGVELVHILSKHHESAGVKSPAEDILLVLMHAGTVLTSRQWLPTVTQSLIVPPPLWAKSDARSAAALKLANAVSFHVDNSNSNQNNPRTTFDSLLTPQTESATTDELNQSSGASFAAPVWDGAALAMRLETYRQLPMHDESLTEAWPANLDLSLALWLCADGIDHVVAATSSDNKNNGNDNTEPPHDALTVKWVDPKLNPATSVTAPLSPAMGARFAEAWMDELLQRKYFHWYTHSYKELTYLEWQTSQAQARQSPTFVRDLAQKCRSLEWYIETMNPPDWATVLEQSAVVDRVKPETGGNNEDEKSEAMLSKDVKEALAKFRKHHSEMKRQEHAGAAEAGNEHGNNDNNEGEEDEDSVAIPARREPKKPSKPLCEECLQIVEKAKPFSLEKVDVSGGHKEHPHMGAKDEHGKYGYIHDETHLVKNPPKFNMSEEDLLAACKRRDNNYKMLTEQVFVDVDGHKKADEELHGERAKIFCLVYTTEKGHSNIPRIRETWGQKCDGFMVGSTKTDPSIDTVEIPHEGPEEYDNIWQKVRSMWSYIYDNYYEKYDWFHIGGDDMYLLVENLRLYLESEEIRTAANGGIYLPDGSETSQTPLFLGRRFAYMGDMKDIFNSGGSGYTLNKAALKAMVVDGIPNFRPHAKTFSEDTMVARLLATFGVYPYETKDENGGERYMPFMPGHHYGYRMPADKSKDWYAKYSINIKTGKEHCAKRSVAFHYVKANAMYRLHALLYNLCPAGSLS